MPQDSIYYAIGRLSVLQKNALDQTKLDRLLQAPSAQDARHALAEIGWTTGENYEQMAAAHVEQACQVTRRLATNEKLIACFLLRYDVNNLKILLKARCLGAEAESLSLCGVYSVDTLRHDVAEHRYTNLDPILAAALDGLEKRLAVSPDPLDVDVTLDKAQYETIFSWLPKNARTERAFFTAKADLVNLSMALRALHMGKPASFFKEMLLPGGTIAQQAWLSAYEKPEKLPQLVKGYGPKVYQAALAAQSAPGRIAQLERAMDDYLLSVYAPYRQRIDTAQRIVGYLLMREREAAAVRLIMAGKTAGFAEEKIRERLRDLYG